MRTFGKLTITRNLNFGTTQPSRSQDASAAAGRGSYGPVELWLAGNAQVDMYEWVYNDLGFREMLRLPSIEDNAPPWIEFLRSSVQTGKPPSRPGVTGRKVSDVQPNIRPQPSRLQQPKPSPPSTPPPLNLRSRRKRQSSLQNWKRKFGALPGEAEPSKPIANDAQSGAGPSQPTSSESPAMPGGMPGPSPTPAPRQPQGQVMPLSNIESNIKQAIAACRGERGNVLQNREHMETVREILDEGYCDIFGRVSELIHRPMSDIEVFVAKDVPDGGNILAAKHDVITKFIHAIRPLRMLYKVPPTSVNVSFGLQGDSIAFDRDASIFVNLRYFESWLGHLPLD
ncbi:hypothetical protein M0805_008031 [Coniferiporia weirii]|nr:hypothetical protein M0805_008031 [Coniferiporia weirii]